MDKKLLFVIHGMPAGGAERVASIALAHWCSTGTDTTLLTFSSSDTDHYPLPPELKRVYANIFWDSHNALHSAISYLKRLGMIRREVKTVAPDVIVSFIDSTNVLVLIACLGTGIPVVVSERTDPREHVIKPLWRRLRKLVYRYADFIVVQTQNVAVWAQALTAADRVKVIANPLRTLDLPIPWDERTKDIIAVGRLVPLKGFDILIRAFAASTAPNQGWRLKIFGEGAERLALTALIEELSLRDAVDLCGITEDPTIELNRAKMFILSSKYEGFP
ncbi:MAG: GalNAc-alpha-(1-_4)-GalNAc-alpha-(1-_3)-diNAcBac-PP-undecaprenol alpha-1,4-N-acetyl-D-galactosaminyltransferase, partial [Candidatus Azotimanducaceae bacterium]